MKASISRAAIPPTIAPTIGGVMLDELLLLLSATLVRPLLVGALAVGMTVDVNVEVNAVAITEPPGNVVNDVSYTVVTKTLEDGIEGASEGELDPVLEPE